MCTHVRAHILELVYPAAVAGMTLSVYDVVEANTCEIEFEALQ